tara:strand:+ start:14672 stop:15418 length:747 start_codon:yes stop_codon:yes gene_type:complete
MKILVIGESCNDIFIYGACDRLAPAAPVPVFRKEPHLNDMKISTGGMAMNVYNNISSFGDNVEIITNKNWEDISKKRYVDYRTNYIVLRVDTGDHAYGSVDLDSINFDDYEAVIISDYDKGYLSEEDIEKISESHPLTFLDTKKILDVWAEKITFIKINNFEFDRTKNVLPPNFVNKMVVTLGPDGCRYLDRVFPVPKVDIRDTSGAGDTFIAGLVSSYIKHRSIERAIEFANTCATSVVQKKGIGIV